MNLLWLLCALFSASSAIHHHGGEHSHGYHVHKFHAVPTAEPPPGLENAMSRTMDLEIRAGEYTFHLDLTLKTLQWGKGAQIITEVDAKGKPTKTEPLFHRGYTGTAYISNGITQETGTASVTFFEDQRASLAVVTDHDIYDINIMELISEGLTMKGQNAGHKMFMTRMSDVKLPQEEANEHIKKPFRHRLRQFIRKRPGSRHLNQLMPFTNCFANQASTQRAMRIGMMSDPQFESKVGGSANARNQMIADLNKATDTIYAPQLRIWLLAGSIYVGSAVPSAIRTCPGTSAKLSAFRDWRRGRGKDNHGLFHLWTNCHPPPGTVGLAYVGVLCDHNYGTGWSNYINNGGTWKVVAHELGHNFGAGHSFDNGQGRTGGIMDYGDGYYPPPNVASSNRAIAFNPLRRNDICGEISGAVSQTSSWLIPANQCWTTYGGNPPQPSPSPVAPVPVTRPTNRPTTRKPTPRPTSTGGTSSCTGITMTASWYFKRNNANCYWYQRSLTAYKPCIQRFYSCSVTTPSSWPTYRLVQLKFQTSGAVYNSFSYNAWLDGMTAALKTFGITFYRRRLAGAPQPPPLGTNATNGDPVITYQWVRNPNSSFTGCTPACGSYRYQLESYVCEQTADGTANGGSISTMVMQDQTLCGMDLKPIKPHVCPAVACSGSCGDGVVHANEICDTGINNCCATGCQGYLTSQSCLTKNMKIDATFMTCLNDVTKSDCFLYVFQGEYFTKYYAVPGTETHYSKQWTNGAIKHRGTFQHTWNTVTAVAGGRNGQVWAFRGLDFQKIDYSNENAGKVIQSGRVDTNWQAPAAFTNCGSVTGAEVVTERYLMLFCKNIYIHVYLPTEKANATVYPADSLFPASPSDVGVNAFYYDVRDSTYRIFRRDVQDLYRQPGLMSRGTATMNPIFGLGAQPTISSSQCALKDPECTACTGVSKCTACQPNYKVLVERCIPEATLVDMTFAKNSVNDKYYSSDPALQTGTFTTDHGRVPDGAMVFTPSTHVMARAPTLGGRTVANFRIEVFYKPNTISARESLVTIDSRFEVDLQSFSTNTFKLFVRFDNMNFDCYVAKPLTVNTWNLVAVEFANRQIITSVNGFEHNRGFTQVAGGPLPLGLTFQNVTIGAKANGLDGSLDSLLIKEVPIRATGGGGGSGGSPSTAAKASEAWVVPVIIVAVLLGVCLIGFISFLAYQRGMCGGKETSGGGGNDVQTAFLSASGQNQTGGSGGDYIAM